jgi:Pyruvate kinase, barrel domain
MRSIFVKPIRNLFYDTNVKDQRDLELMVTLWPSFPHFKSFARNKTISGIRLNSAMMSNPELDKELDIIKNTPNIVAPLFFDIKGRQLRVTEVIPNKDHLDIRLNHPIRVHTPCVVLFKAGADVALLDHLEEDGQRLVFRGGPQYMVTAGESLHIREKDLEVRGDIFTPLEKEKIVKVKSAGFTKYFLSYVEKQSDIDQFQELVGKDAEIWLKIESKAGLEFVNSSFQKRDNLVLVAARGDLFVELDKPHHILEAQRQIIQKDPEACVGSRILLSVINSPVPSCSDLTEIAWLHDIGYRRMMLCDELCLKENLLSNAVAVFNGIKHDL